MHINFNLSKKIIPWYEINKRDLPWRVSKYSKEHDYYRLLSEFMLQQTQVKTVIPYFKQFIKSVPTLKSLSKTNIKKVMKLWEGLGYYRRAKNLLQTSKILQNQNNGRLPDNHKDLMKLPGIGEYTANALLALVYNKAVLAIDGNVKRVIARIIKRKEDQINFNKFLEINHAKIFNTKKKSTLVEAMMEFGATVCTPQQPRCFNCCLKKNCKSYNLEKKSTSAKKKYHKKQYDILCYINLKKQIALKKNNNLGFLHNNLLPIIKSRNLNFKKNSWSFFKNYKKMISNKKLDINLYYKFSSKIPKDMRWFNLNESKTFVPTFTKNIINEVKTLY